MNSSANYGAASAFKDSGIVFSAGLELNKAEFFHRVSEIAGLPGLGGTVQFVDGQILEMRDALADAIIQNPRGLVGLPESVGLGISIPANTLWTADSARETAGMLMDAMGIKVPEAQTVSASAATSSPTVVEAGGNMNTYLANSSNVGSLSGSADLTEADSLTLSHLSYMSKLSDNPDYRAASLASGMSVGEYCSTLKSKLLECCSESELKKLEKEIAYLDNMANSDRYKNLQIAENDALWAGEVSDHVMVIEYPGTKEAFFAIEGTDGTISGWRTDGGYGREVDTTHEKWVRNTFERYADRYQVIDMGGHSRGGHLAAYCLLTTHPELADRVKSVYSLDGPGFSQAFYDKYQREIEVYGERIHNIRPCCSVVGAITPTGETIGSVKYVPLNTSDVGVMSAHEEWYWAIDENGNLESVPPTQLSLFVHDAVSKACSRLTDAELSYFCEELFELMRDDSDGSFGQSLNFGAVFDNLIKDIEDCDMESVGAALGTLCVLVDRGLLYDILPVEWKAPVRILGAVLMQYPACQLAYAKLRMVVKLAAMLYSWYVEKMMEQRRQARAQYLASNPTALITGTNIDAAIACMQTAETAMKDAKELYGRLYSHVEYTFADIFLGLGFVTIAKFFELLFGHLAMSGSNRVNKMYSALGRVKGYWENMEISIQSILAQQGYACSNEIQVTPAQLKKAAKDMLDRVEDFERAFNEADQEIEDLYNDKSWQGEDYTEYRNSFIADFQTVPGKISQMKEYCETMGAIADNYAQVQDDSVNEFQMI